MAEIVLFSELFWEGGRGWTSPVAEGRNRQFNGDFRQTSPIVWRL